MDPISSAIAGAASKTVDATAGDQKLKHAVLMPVAHVVGQELAERAKRWFEKGNAKRMEYLNEHVERAIKFGGPEKLEAIADDPSFVDWASGVSKVDPDDKDLSSIWQAALLALQTGGVRRLRILNIARQLQPDEAAAFLAYARGEIIDTGANEGTRNFASSYARRASFAFRSLMSNPHDQAMNSYRRRFLGLGLAQGKLQWLLSSRMGLLLVISLCGAVALDVLLEARVSFVIAFLNGLVPNKTIVFIESSIGVLIVYLGMFLLLLLGVLDTLTADGRSLLRLVDQVLKEPSAQDDEQRDFEPPPQKADAPEAPVNSTGWTG